MRIAIAAAIIAGCVGPTPAGLPVAPGDIAGMRKLVHRPLSHGVLWFVDAACAREFSLPGDVADAQLARFADCLAGLQLEASPRKSSVGDVVLRGIYGVELLAHTSEDLSGPVLLWIGLAFDGPPIVAPDALEKVRASGEPNGTLDAATGEALLAHARRFGQSAESAWLEVCLDTTGAIHRTHVLTATSIAAARAFETSARTWTFRPFVVGQTAIPVCSLVEMTYPASKHPSTEHLPVPYPPDDELVTLPVQVLGERLDGVTTLVPRDDDKVRIQHAGIDKFEIAYRYCIDATGAVSRVQPVRVSGLAEYDARVADSIHGWRYAPYREDGAAPTPACSTVVFHYNQHR